MEMDECEILSTFLSSNAWMTPDFLEMKRLSLGELNYISYLLDTLFGYKIRKLCQFWKPPFCCKTSKFVANMEQPT